MTAAVDIRTWAIKGAGQRLVELAEEAKAIFATFPELRGQGRGLDLSAAGQRRAKGPTPRCRPAPWTSQDVRRGSPADWRCSASTVGRCENQQRRR